VLEGVACLLTCLTILLTCLTIPPLSSPLCVCLSFSAALCPPLPLTRSPSHHTHTQDSADEGVSQFLRAIQGMDTDVLNDAILLLETMLQPNMDSRPLTGEAMQKPLRMQSLSTLANGEGGGDRWNLNGSIGRPMSSVTPPRSSGGVPLPLVSHHRSRRSDVVAQLPLSEISNPPSRPDSGYRVGGGGAPPPPPRQDHSLGLLDLLQGFISPRRGRMLANASSASPTSHPVSLGVV